jgi:hypothetical protein
MKINKKKFLGTIIAILAFVLIASFVLLKSDYMQSWHKRKFFALWNEGIEDAQNRRVLLLCDTDLQALLKAGREILNQVPKDRLNPGPGGPRTLGNFSIPKGVQIPKAIRDLKPRGCFISYDGYLMLEMHGGMDHFGVQIYPEDYKKPDPPFKYGDRELLPGLWYYDEGYNHNPQYDKRIDELIEKHKKKN